MKNDFSLSVVFKTSFIVISLSTLKLFVQNTVSRFPRALNAICCEAVDGKVYKTGNIFSRSFSEAGRKSLAGSGIALTSMENKDSFQVNIPTTSLGERQESCCVCGNSTEFYHRIQTDGNLLRRKGKFRMRD